ncbi:MAG: hypothetical protein MJ054_00530, partial [Clostridia bacterium]|nr:hypothetical protein [Clostridia bacterium]
GVHAVFGYVETFGYGTIDVSGFVPENGIIRTLTEIKYEPQENSSYQNATWGNVDIGGNNDTVDWFKVCVVLAVVSIILYIINNLRERMRSFSKQGETEDDN